MVLVKNVLKGIQQLMVFVLQFKVLLNVLETAAFARGITTMISATMLNYLIAWTVKTIFTAIFVMIIISHKTVFA